MAINIDIPKLNKDQKYTFECMWIKRFSSRSPSKAYSMKNMRSKMSLLGYEIHNVSDLNPHKHGSMLDCIMITDTIENAIPIYREMVKQGKKVSSIFGISMTIVGEGCEFNKSVTIKTTFKSV